MELVIVLAIIIFFLLGLIIIAYVIGKKTGEFRRNKWWEAQIPNHRKDAILKSRAVLGGYFSEQLAPYLPDFKYLPTECRFVGKPIDFLVFKGMDNKNIEEVIFVEVKSGNAKLSPTERKLKQAIKDKKVRWREYRVPLKLTKNVDIEDIENSED